MFGNTRIAAVCYKLYFSIICFALTHNKQASSDQIKKVHIVSMNHLDVGYYDGSDADVGFAVQVLNRYQTEYFQRAIQLSLSLIENGYSERFIYTTHPWLVSLYLDCPTITLLSTPLKCPSPDEQDLFRKAVRDGHIAWHAFPMNIQTDFLGAALFEYGLSLGHQLDAQFGINRTHATMSQRDIPGMTKALLPLLIKNGVKAISVGVNPGTAPPAVPSPFVWKLRDSDDDGVLAFWDKGGYPVNPGPDPAHPRGLAREKCVITPGLDEALCFAFRTDNTGPPTSVEEWLGYMEILRAEFPGAELVASTFDLFVASLDKVKDSLPVRSFEIGDTWIQGVASDPLKAAVYRGFVRAWENCTAEGQCKTSDPRIQAMLRYLIKLPEHTWGAHDFLDHTDWTNEALAEARKSQMFKLAEDAWREQRQFLGFAMDALKDHPLSEQFEREMLALEAKPPNLTGYHHEKINQEFGCPGGIKIQFGSDGSLISLLDGQTNRQWASPDSPVGRLTYDTYTEEDFKAMAKLYNYEAGVGYDKPDVTKYAHPEKRRWKTMVSAFYKKKSTMVCDFWIKVVMADDLTHTKYGAPLAFYVNYVTNPQHRGLDVTLLMLGKTTTRLPESVSFSHSPVLQENDARPGREGLTWSISKMGQSIDPCDVVLNGSQYVHGVDTGVSLLDQSEKGLRFVSLDVSTVLIGTETHTDSPFPVPLQPLQCQTDRITTMAFNIYNNIWNTNFIYWYPYNDGDANFKARFSIRLQD